MGIDALLYAFAKGEVAFLSTSLLSSAPSHLPPSSKVGDTHTLITPPHTLNRIIRILLAGIRVIQAARLARDVALAAGFEAVEDFLVEGGCDGGFGGGVGVGDGLREGGGRGEGEEEGGELHVEFGVVKVE